MTPEELAQVVAAVKAELEPPEVDPRAVGGFFQVVPGETITADHMNTALVNGAPKFLNAAARNSQWPSPPQGALCYLQDVNYFEVYDSQITGGSVAWHPIGGLRMGYARMGFSQSIPNGSVETLVKLGEAGGAAGKLGRASWAANGEVTVPLTGTYLATGNVTWPANSTGERRLYLKINGGFAGTAGGTSEINTGAVGSTLLRMSVAAMLHMNAGQKIGMYVQHSASSALTLAADGGDVARLGVHMLGAD